LLYDGATDAAYSPAIMNELQTAYAFVVQFRGDCECPGTELCGRVEHVASGRTAIFQSVDQLPAVLRRMLADLSGT
jgi:hypothetical protein